MKNKNCIKILILFLSLVFTLSPIHNAFSDAGNGAKLWVDNCARCHNMRNPTEYNVNQWKAIMAHMRVRAGLTKQESDDIYQFLTSALPMTNSVSGETNIQNEDKKENSVQDSNNTNQNRSGKAIYQQSCIACHGENGKGAIPGVLDITGKNSPLLKHSDAVLLKRIEEGFQGPGSTMAMPPKGGNPNLTHEEIKSVLLYMKQTFGH